ncbi:MAG: polysaccharide deacetylase family protein [Bryobacteraceae bacterium]|jgi:peptidoglycan/xylan/chitin deacetylase (PgdA/CDA1 family)
MAARALPESKRHSAILAYHSIGGGSRFSEPAEQFEKQMNLLAASFTIVPLRTLLAALPAGGERLAAITFDDGFEDLYTCAFPILRKHGLPFTVFLPTGFLEGGSAFFRWSPHYAGLPPLTWEQVREMMTEGCSVGSHTHSHARLSDCTPDEVFEELTQSKRILERRTGTEATALAYPFGQPHDYDQRVILAARAAGYDSGFTALQTCIRSIPNRYEIPRITIDASDGTDDFVQKITGRRDFMAGVEAVNSALVRTGLRRQSVIAPRSTARSCR